MSRRNDLPIILSHGTHTGIVIFPNRRMCGRDLLIVGLNRDVPSGEEFDWQDVNWIKAVLHFGDVEALQVTVDVLAKELKRWRAEGENG